MARRGRPARKAGRDAGFATGSALSICNDMAVIQVPHQHAHASAVAGEFAHELRWLCFTWDSVGPGDAGARRGGCLKGGTGREACPFGGGEGDVGLSHDDGSSCSRDKGADPDRWA